MRLTEEIDRMDDTELRDALRLLARTVPGEVARAIQAALARNAGTRLARATIVPGEIIESRYHDVPGRASGGTP